MNSLQKTMEMGTGRERIQANAAKNRPLDIVHPGFGKIGARPASPQANTGRCTTAQLPISVVIFAKNEARSLPSVLEAPINIAEQVILMNGASNDDSANIGKKSGAIVVDDTGNGKGLAIQKGFQTAAQSIIVLMDADGSHDARDIAKLIEPIQNNVADLVIASRIKGGSDEFAGSISKVLRLMGNLFITTLINWRFRTNLTDTLNGFRAIKADFANSLELKEKTHTIEHEMVIKALRHGGRVIERSSHEYSRRYGVTSLPFWRNAPRFILSTFRYLLYP